MPGERIPDILSCETIQPRLAEFHRESLDPRTTQEVQEHLLTCRDCGERYGALILANLDREAEVGVQWSTPRSLPPPSLYSQYLLARNSRLGVLWSSVQQMTDPWARDHRARVVLALQALLGAPALSRGSITRRGGTRRSVQAVELPSDERIKEAVVLQPTLDATSMRVPFRMVEEPSISSNHVLESEIETNDLTCEGWQAVCTLVLPDVRVSFCRPLLRDPNTATLRAAFREEQVGLVAGKIPWGCVQLSVIPMGMAGETVPAHSPLRHSFSDSPEQGSEESGS